MDIVLDCLPCMLKQVLTAAELISNSPSVHKKIVDEAIQVLSSYESFGCSPELALAMHRIVKKFTNEQDPYKHVKERDIRAAIQVYPFLKRFLEENNNSLLWALKIAATGNIIDSAINNDVDIGGCVQQELEQDFRLCDIDIFEKTISTANTLLLIGDNAGETVFDRVLIERLVPLRTIYAVRNNPIINDATILDAKKSGLEQCSDIVSTGCDAPGAVLSCCSKAFTELFYNADVVISKGQGNYEALSDVDREVFFLLKAKCSVISQRIGVAVKDYVFIRHKTFLPDEQSIL